MRVATTHDWPNRPRWTAATSLIPVEQLSPAGQVRAILDAARKYQVLVLNGSLSGRIQPLAAVLVARMRDPPEIVLTDCTWKAGNPPLNRTVRRAAVRALDGPHLTCCVLSTFERERFSQTWGTDPARVEYTPWFIGLPEDQYRSVPVENDGHIFAGGDSLREWGPLLAVANDLYAPLVVASRVLAKTHIPAGVQAGPVSPARFAELTERAATVVVPLEKRDDRSAGQAGYLNAMALGKPVVVTDAPGVRDYIDHQRTGLVVPPGDPAALRDAVNWTLAPETRAEALAMGARAREDVLARFTADQYVDRILEVVEGASIRAPRR